MAQRDLIFLFSPLLEHCTTLTLTIRESWVILTHLINGEQREPRSLKIAPLTTDEYFAGRTDRSAKQPYFITRSKEQVEGIL